MALWYPQKLNYNEFTQAEKLKQISDNTRDTVIGLDGILSQLAVIAHKLEEPLGGQVLELYNKGCLWQKRGAFQSSINWFERAIKLDDDSFLCHYRLGVLRLAGDNEYGSVIDVDKANKELVRASILAQQMSTTNSEIIPVLANCLLLTSESFYRKVSYEDIPNDPNLKEAINYANKAINNNPNISMAHYYLARYYSLLKETSRLESNLKCAIEMDARCLELCKTDHAFDANRELVEQLIINLTNEAKRISDLALEHSLQLISYLENYKITKTAFNFKVKNLKDRYFEAAKADTYQGYLSILNILSAINLEAEDLKNWGRILARTENFGKQKMSFRTKVFLICLCILPILFIIYIILFAGNHAW